MSYSLLADRYQVGDVIGRGGLSEVHRGRDRRLERDVAVKVLRRDLARDPNIQERFRREAQNASALNHPNIVAVYDSGIWTDGDITIPYIVMEYVDGDVLRDMLTKDGPPPTRRALEMVADICVALDFSHRRGVVHRDIRPANVMLSKAGVIKVMDFGTARLGDGQANTTATAVVGTAHYLSPEQINGGRVDARSDIYATGCVLYELLCGRPPFTGPTPVAVAHQHVREVASPPSDFAPGLPRQLDAVTLKAMSKNPMNRYQNAAEMRADLLRALAGEPVSATPLLREVQPVQTVEARALVGAAAGQWGSPPSVQDRRPSTATRGPALLAPVETLPEIEADERAANDRAITRRRMRLAVIVAVSASVIAAIWLTLLVVTAPPIAPKVSVPDLSGMTLEQAQATLRDKQLTLGTVTEVDSPKASTGRVVNQRPSELTQVDETTPVNIEIDNS